MGTVGMNLNGACIVTTILVVVLHALITVLQSSDIMSDRPPSYVSSDPWGDVDYGAVHAARSHTREHDESAPLIPGTYESKRPSRAVCFLFAMVAATFLAAAIVIHVHISSDLNTAASVDRRHRVELRRLNATHGAILDNLTEQYKRQLDSVDRSHRAEIRRLNVTHGADLDNLTEQNKRQLREARSEYEQRLEAKDRWVQNQKRLLSARESAVHDAEVRVGSDTESKKKANLYWEQPPIRGRVCTGWKALPYSAKLHNVPRDVDGVAWCQGTSLHMPGMEEIDKPEYCEQTENGSIVAHWTHRKSANCHTLWGNQKDQGCQAGSPGNRLVEMQLLDHHAPWDSWLELCETTPWGDEGRAPDVCEHRRNKGVWGKWFVHDMKCEKVSANEQLE